MPIVNAVRDMWTWCTTPAGLITLGAFATLFAVVEMVAEYRTRRAN